MVNLIITNIIRLAAYAPRFFKKVHRILKVAIYIIEFEIIVVYIIF